jgi:hypothetical protein
MEVTWTGEDGGDMDWRERMEVTWTGEDGGDMDWTGLAQNMEKSWALVKAVMNLRVP